MGIEPKIDPMKLDEEQRHKLEKWNQNKQIITYLSDVANMFQEVSTLLNEDSKEEKKTTKELGALIVDIRDNIVSLNNKETPEMPDTAKPIVDAVSKLEKALTKSIDGIEVKPSVSVAAPDVKVDAPQVDVDLRGVEKILKTDLPKAFKDSMKLIPKPERFDPKPLLDAWKGISEQLTSLETATRLKPAPGATTISNLPFTPGVDANYLDVQQTDSDTETYVFKQGGVTGDVVRTIVVNYTSSAKTDIDTVSWS